MSHKQILVIRKDLKTRRGKDCSQAAHSSLAAIFNTGSIKEIDGIKSLVIPLTEQVEPWIMGRFKKICVYVNSEEELLAIHNQAKELGLITSLIQDAGLTEFGGVPTYTAVAVGPDEEAKIDEVTGLLPLL